MAIKGGKRVTPVTKNGMANGFAFTGDALGGERVTLVDDSGNEILLTGGGVPVDLSNYYTKEETYNKIEVDEMIDTVTSNFTVIGVVETVEDLPTNLTEENQGYIYFVGLPTDTVLEQYVWTGTSWLPIGTNEIDLSNYYTINDVDTLLSYKADITDVYTITQLNTLLNLKADKSNTYTITETDEAIATAVDGIVTDVSLVEKHTVLYDSTTPTPAGKEITLSDDINNYDYIEVIGGYQTGTTISFMQSQKILKEDYLRTDWSTTANQQFMINNSTLSYDRRLSFGITANNKITVGISNLAILVKVIGVKTEDFSNQLSAIDTRVTTLENAPIGTVSSVNTKTGEVVLYGEDILIDNDYYNVPISDALKYLNGNKAEVSSVNLNSMPDFEKPIEPSLLYWDSDNKMKGTELIQRGTDNTQSAQVYTSINKIYGGGAQQEMVFNANKVKGTQFAVVGNGIQVLDSSQDFEVACVLTYNLSAYWSTYPVTIYAKLFKNGVYTGLQETEEVLSNTSDFIKFQDVTKSKIEEFTTINDNDIFTIQTQILDVNGQETGSWAEYIVNAGSNLSFYNRSIVKSGLYIKANSSLGQRAKFLKTGSQVCPRTTTPFANNIISFDTSNAIINDPDNIHYDSATNEIVFNNEFPRAYRVQTVLPMNKVSGGSTTANILLMLAITKDGVQFGNNTNTRTVALINNATRTLEYQGFMQFEEVGEYRVKMLWLDQDTNGTVSHSPSTHTIGDFTYNETGAIEFIEVALT